MFCDNSAALLIANEPGVQMGAKHYHRSNLLKVHTDDNLAYPFTKALLKGKLTQHAKKRIIPFDLDVCGYCTIPAVLFEDDVTFIAISSLTFLAKGIYLQSLEKKLGRSWKIFGCFQVIFDKKKLGRSSDVFIGRFLEDDLCAVVVWYYDLAHLKIIFEFSIYNVWNSVQYGVSNGLDKAYWGFLGVGTTFDIFQNIILIPYLEYGVLSPLDTAY
ncbi:hypothetical protein Tco_0184368 [Tanacetum coccineum]